jgi:hypothetical protein
VQRLVGIAWPAQRLKPRRGVAFVSNASSDIYDDIDAYL